MAAERKITIRQVVESFTQKPEMKGTVLPFLLTVIYFDRHVGMYGACVFSSKVAFWLEKKQKKKLVEL